MPSFDATIMFTESHPAWDAWIEMSFLTTSFTTFISRIPHGMRGLKYKKADRIWRESRRIPHGMRGLKYRIAAYNSGIAESHPAWDAWIEISDCWCCHDCVPLSHPAWDAWIEICRFYNIASSFHLVASRMGCVD